MRGIGVLLLLIAFHANSQNGNALNGLFETAPNGNVLLAQKRIDYLVDHLTAKRPGSEVNFLRRIFSETHRKFFKSYSQYSSINELFTEGKYDCLTATAMYSILLDRLEFDYKIIETNYHIFIMVTTSRGEVLLETTDPWNGFVTDSKGINQRINGYQENKLSASSGGDKQLYAYHFNLYHSLEQRELPGLLYFNQAVKAYNCGEWNKCAALLIRAQSIYDSPRIAELVMILVQSVQQSDWSAGEKDQFMSTIREVNVYSDSVVASR